MNSLILNLPYSSCLIPPIVSRRLGFSDDELRLEHWNLCDPRLAVAVKEARFRKLGGERPVIIYPYSPLVADPLGFWSSELGGEDFSPSILPHGSSGRIINWPEKDRDIIFKRSVAPYYQRLENEVNVALEDSPLVLVMTLRSYTSKPLGF